MNKFKNYLLAVLLGVCTQAFAGPTLTTVATPDPATVGFSFDVDVMIADVADLYAYQFTLGFDASKFKATAVTDGAFLASAGATFSDVGMLDNDTGTLSFVFNTLLGPQAGANGSGALLHITFEALNAGTSALMFSDVLFLDSALADIDVAVTDGAITAVPEPAGYLLFGAALIAAGVLRRKQHA